MLIYNQKETKQQIQTREVKNMRKIDELSMEEYMDVVIASGYVEDFKGWCEKHDVDYADAMAYDWD